MGYHNRNMRVNSVYDASILCENFMKQTALVLSLQATNKELIYSKATELRNRIGLWRSQNLFDKIAKAISLPLVNLVADDIMVTKEVMFYYTQLGLDEASLKRLATITKADYTELKSIVDRRLGCKDFNEKYIAKVVRAIPTPSADVISKIIQSITATNSVCQRTCHKLFHMLDEMESIALEIAQFAAESAANSEESDDI